MTKTQAVFFASICMTGACGVRRPVAAPDRFGHLSELSEWRRFTTDNAQSPATDFPTCGSRWPGSLPSLNETLLGSFIGVRPGFHYSLASTRYPLVVHAMNSTKVEYATKILAYADKSWEEIVEHLGFRAPRADDAGEKAQGDEVDGRIDIYIRDDLMAGVGGYTGFTGFDDTTPEVDAVGYLVIADLLTDVYIRGVVAHEFFHLSQMAYDWFEHPGFMEATAVWVTDHVFDDENFYSRYYAYYNKTPSQALDHISLADPYQYGAGMWYQYFDEKFGKGNGSAIRRLWEGTVQPEMDNEPDFFEGMRSMVGGAENLKNEFSDFGASRLLVASRADGHHLREAELWSERVIPTFIELGDMTDIKTVTWAAPAGMEPYSHAFLRGINIPEDAKMHFEFDVSSDKNIRVEEIKTSTKERVVILTRLFDGEYDPEKSPKEAVAVSGKITFDFER
jgi:hypothetical protein